MRCGFLRLPLLTLLSATLSAAAWAQPAPSDSRSSGGATRTDSGLPAAGGPAAAGEAAEQGPAPSASVSASPLDTFLLRDSKGNLVPVLGMTFEEFEQLWRLKKGLAAPAAPDYIFDSLTLVGTADEQRARLQVTASIHVRTDDWVRVPLLLRRAIISQPPKHQGPGEHFLTFDEAAGGYVCWLKGNQAKPHVVSLEITTGISRVGDERRLELALPRATEAALRLSVPDPGAVATLHAGDGIVSTRELTGGGSELSLLGPAGELELAWRTGQRPLAQRAAQLDANGEILVRVESEHRVTSDARLRVRSYGVPLEAFQVRLPAGMELVPISLAGYRLTPVMQSQPQSDLAGSADAGQLIEVRFDRPMTGAAEVRLLTTLQADTGPANGLAPARFEVLDAVRQRGTIDFIVDGEWQLDWTLDSSARRLEVAPDSANRAVARFEYFRQPCGLQLKVTARPSRINVEPAHVVSIDAKEMRIKSALKYRFRGARTTKLIFELGDWQLLQLAPAELFELPAASSERTGHVEIPVRSDAALPAEIELQLEAHRPLLPGAERLSFTLPRPSADLVAPANVSILVADNVEVTPLAGELVGLSVDATLTRTPGEPHSALAYRDLGNGEPALFAAALRHRLRLTKAGGRATVRLDRRQMQIEQRLEYSVQHEPQQAFSLLAPRAALANDSLSVTLADVPQAIVSSSDPSGLGASLVRIDFSPASEQIGTFQVDVRYALPLAAWDAQRALPLQIPIALPVADGNYEFSGQEIEFELAEGLHIEPDMEDLEVLESQPAGGNRFGYSWAQAEPLSAWLLAPSNSAPAATIAVDRMWVQTWLTASVRQERAVFQLNSPLESLRIRLPKGALRASIRAAVDGVEVVKSYRDPDQVIVSLPDAARGKVCVLEVYYALDPPPRQLGLLAGDLQPAHIDSAAPPRRTYWQLALPEDEHLALMPRSLAMEMPWTSGNWLALRRPALDEQQLERWIGASRQDALPRGGNIYLFGGLGTTPVLEVVAVERQLMIAVASAVALLAGLALLHVARLRRPGMLLAGAVLVAALALAAPDLALLAAQAATLGLAIAGAAAAWTWFRSGRSFPAAAPPSTIAARPRESALVQPPLVARPDRSSQITATAPAAAIEVRP